MLTGPSYLSRDDVIFPSKKGMRSYLQSESKLWTPFLDYVRDGLNASMRRNYDSDISPESIALSLASLLSRIENRNEFYESTGQYSRDLLTPPPSDSLDGLLIRGLFDAGYKEESLACFVFLASQDAELTIKNGDRIYELRQRGKSLVEAAPLVLALPYSKVSNAKMAGAVRIAENHVQALSEEIVQVQELHERHEADLYEHLEEQKEEASRINRVVLRLNKRRDGRQRAWETATQEIVNEKFKEAQKKVQIFELNSQRAEEARVKEFDRLQDLFKTQLRLRAPVKLWEDRQATHTKQAKSAMHIFIGIGILAIFFWTRSSILGRRLCCGKLL